MEPTIKDKYIILGFIGVAICLISFFITLIVSASFNQDNFVRLIVFVCSNILGCCSISLSRRSFRLIRDLETQVRQEKGICRNHKAQEEQPQDANEPAAPTPMPTGGEATPDIKPVEIAIAPELHEKNRASYETDRSRKRRNGSAWSWSTSTSSCPVLPTRRPSTISVPRSTSGCAFTATSPSR
mgnify:CR=1 FL=1